MSTSRSGKLKSVLVDYSTPDPAQPLSVHLMTAYLNTWESEQRMKVDQRIRTHNSSIPAYNGSVGGSRERHCRGFLSDSIANRATLGILYRKRHKIQRSQPPSLLHQSACARTQGVKLDDRTRAVLETIRPDVPYTAGELAISKAGIGGPPCTVYISYSRIQESIIVCERGAYVCCYLPPPLPTLPLLLTIAIAGVFARKADTVNGSNIGLYGHMKF
ncbi:hypothetical protein CBL_00220 [Carabus blaptoides fortunei]